MGQSKEERNQSKFSPQDLKPERERTPLRNAINLPGKSCHGN